MAAKIGKKRLGYSVGYSFGVQFLRGKHPHTYKKHGLKYPLRA